MVSSVPSHRGLQHMMPYIIKSAWHLVVHLVWTADVDLVVLVLNGQTNLATNRICL